MPAERVCVVSLTKCEPLKMSPLPPDPGQELCIAYCGPFPNGDCFLVVVDDYSRYPVIEKVLLFNRPGFPVRCF